jgi:cytochrome c553
MQFFHTPFPALKMKFPIVFCAIALCSTGLASAAQPSDHQDSGKEINATCAGCHGDQGQGGKRGEYPRLAGQRAAFLEYSLKQFRSRERINLPMLPYTQERELPDADIKAVSAYLAAIVLPTKPPDFKPTDDALTRLEAMEKVMIIPKLKGDLENGKTLYLDLCAICHGNTGKGYGTIPMLVGQYVNYLQRQIDIYLRGERLHDQDSDEEEEGGQDKDKAKRINLGVLGQLKPKDIDDILAHITWLQPD